MRKGIHRVVRKMDFRLSDEDIEPKVKEYCTRIKEGNYDFSTYKKDIFTQGRKKRQIYSFDKMSVENILIHYLKDNMERVFNIRYASRVKIINLLFNTLPVVKDLNDFVIIRADFKSFFDSVLTKHVYHKYIVDSLMSRSDKEILEEYIKQFSFCYAGLCLSNGMTEIVCRDFDKHIRAKLEKYGLILYERYVDDFIVILNSFVSEYTFLNIVRGVIKDVFERCPIRLNLARNKFSYIAKRSLSGDQSFDFLGYKFLLKYNNRLSFKFGIAKKKQDRYKNIIEQAFIEYKKDNNIELLRQRLKIYSTRVVIARGLGIHKFEWLTKGVVANYNELRFHMGDLDGSTVDFLKKIYINLQQRNDVGELYFLKNSTQESSIYNMYSTLERNRSIVFEKKIGVKRRDIVEWIKKIDPQYIELNKGYYQIVIEYLELLKLK